MLRFFKKTVLSLLVYLFFIIYLCFNNVYVCVPMWMYTIRTWVPRGVRQLNPLELKGNVSHLIEVLEIKLWSSRWILTLKPWTISLTCPPPPESLFGFHSVFHTQIILCSITVSSNIILCCPLDLIVSDWRWVRVFSSFALMSLSKSFFLARSILLG